jgi:hypothetical protein
MLKLHPCEVDTPNTPKLLDFHLSGLGFSILFMLKMPLEPLCKHHHILVNECSCHISSQRYIATILVSLSLCISTVLYIFLINRNCVLLYLCVYCNTFVYLSIYLYISLLYLFLHFVIKNNLDQWYKSRMLLIVFQCMSPTRSEYKKLCLELISLNYNHSRMLKKPSIVE